MSVLFAMLVALLLIVIAFNGYFVLLHHRYAEPITADEIHTVTTEDLWQIRLYRHRAAGGAGEPVLFCHSLASNHLNFELPEGHALVDLLSAAGFDCWTLDTRACRDASPPEGLSALSATVDDIVLKDIPAALRYIRERTGYSRAHWVGHSMGGMLLYAYDLKLGGEGLASAATLGSPPGFRGVRFLDHRLLVALDRIAHTPLAMIFRGAAPLYNYWWRPTTQLIPVNWDNLHPALRPRDLFYGLELPKPVIGKQMNEWASRGEWVMFDGTLDVEGNLGKLRTPLLAIFGGIDPFTPEHKIKQFFNSIENSDKKLIVLSRHNGHSANYSHIEIPIAPRTDTEVGAPIIAWFRAHAIGRTPAEATVPAATKRSRAPARPGRRSTAAKARESAAIHALPNVRLSAASNDASNPKPRAHDRKPARETRLPSPGRRNGARTSRRRKEE